MATQTIEISGPAGYTLRVEMFIAGTRTKVLSKTDFDEEIGGVGDDKAGYYSHALVDATFGGNPLQGWYDLVIWLWDGVVETHIGDDQVLLNNVTGTYQAVSIQGDIGRLMKYIAGLL